MAVRDTHPASMAGKVCLVTGATSGLGLVTARMLAERGATVVVVGRDPTRSRGTAADIAARTGASVTCLAADFASQAEVRRLADEFRRRHEQLHVLVNNAGAVVSRRHATPDGVEMTFAVNHLAAFLLTTQLLDMLRASAPARIVTVASVAHEAGELDLDDLDLHRGYRPFRAYARSKLANVLFTYELADRLAGTNVTANALNPGLVRTDLGTKGGWLVGLGWRLVQLRHRRVAVDPETGALTILHLASSPAVEGVSGLYFENCEPVPSSAASRDRDVRMRLWRISEELTAPRTPAIAAA